MNPSILEILGWGAAIVLIGIALCWVIVRTLSGGKGGEL